MQGVQVARKAVTVVSLIIWISIIAGCVTISSTRESSQTEAVPVEGVAKPPAKPATRPIEQPSRPARAPATVKIEKPTARPAISTPHLTEPRDVVPVAEELEIAVPKLPAAQPPSAGTQTGTAERTSPIQARVAAFMREMTLSEKVGQLFILPLYDRRTERYDRTASPQALQIIHEYHPGGIILFGGNIDTIDQTRRLVSDVQKASEIPLFVAVDEEGGTVSRLTASGHMHAVHMPAEAVVGSTNDPHLAYLEGRFVGRELLSLGINMDLAPVADVLTNPANKVIGTRAYGSDPHLAAKMTAAMVRGLQSVGVSSVIKHFPGHGDTVRDSHVGPAVVHHTLSRLRRVEFLPFEAGIAAGADGVMVGHLLLPEILKDKQIPSSFSPFVVGQLLRREMGFRKLIITDALNMGAIVKFWPSGAAALDAFQAGVDMLLMPADPRAAFEAILAAVHSGEITKRRLDDRVRTILTVKAERAMLEGGVPSLDPHKILGSEEGKKLLAEIEQKAAESSKTRP